MFKIIYLVEECKEVLNDKQTETVGWDTINKKIKEKIFKEKPEADEFLANLQESEADTEGHVKMTIFAYFNGETGWYDQTLYRPTI